MSRGCWQERLYDSPETDLAADFALVKRVAATMRSTYDCTGT